jgi:hypothetical protein
VIIDDLGKWISVLTPFHGVPDRFIAYHTFLKTFHWVITLNESDYAYVASENRFWDLYASQISDQTWISLDDLNEEGYASQSGDVLIEKNLALKEIFRANNHNPELRLSGLNRESRNLLSIPLIAWTAVDWLRTEPQKIEVLANLRYIDFIEKLYESREIKVNYHGETLEIEVRATVQEIARGLVAEGEPFSWIEEKSGEYRHACRVFNKNEMISRLSGQSFGYTRLQEDNVARVILDMLENKGFLRKPNKYHVDYFLKLDTQPYWEYQAAINNLCPVVKHETDPHQELERLFGSNGIAREYTGIFEFTLLAMEREQEIEPSRLLGLSVFALNNLSKLIYRVDQCFEN